VCKSMSKFEGVPPALPTSQCRDALAGEVYPDTSGGTTPRLSKSGMNIVSAKGISRLFCETHSNLCTQLHIVQS